MVDCEWWFWFGEEMWPWPCLATATFQPVSPFGCPHPHFGFLGLCLHARESAKRASLAGLHRTGFSDLETDVQLEAIPKFSKRQTDAMMTFITYLLQS